MRVLLKTVKRAVLAGLSCSVLVAALVAASQAGCKNNAITYAKAIWPAAKCDAIETPSGCNSNSPDTAVCRVGGRVYRCVAFAEPKCELVDLP